MSSISTYKFKDGKEITIDFCSVESIQSVPKEYWPEIKEQNDFALNVIKSDIYLINTLTSIGMIPTKKEYEGAKSIIRLYEWAEYKKAEEKARIMNDEIKAIFGEGIIKFNTNIEQCGDKMLIEITPTEPYFDEDYGGEYDDKLDELGKKYDVWVKMESGIYGK